MQAVFKSVGALIISAAILLAGGGLLSTLVAIRAEIEGFPLFAIGLMTSAYFAGFISGCIGTPHLVKRVGHVRVFAALSSLTAAAVLMHIIAVSIPSWIILRMLTGFSFAGLYMLIESWINEQAPNESRGQVLSVYRMVDLAAVTIGQFMLTLADPADFVLFCVVAICVALAIFPISLSTSKAPIAVSQTSLNLKKLVRTVPLAVVGCFSVGMANGAFWGVAPVMVQQLGHPVMMVSTFMSVVIASGALLQWPVGYLSDKFGRRLLLVMASIGAAFSGIFLWQMGPESLTMLLIGGGLFGAFAMQVYGLSAAHANDYAEPHEFVAISGGLLLIYGLGSIVGPSIAPIVMSVIEPSAMFAYTAIIHIFLAVYGTYRRTQRKPADDSTDYVSIPRPRAFAMMLRIDPRALKSKKKTVKSKDL